jgi:glycogen debranching enzyme
MGDGREVSLKIEGAGRALESARSYAVWLGSLYKGDDILLKSIFVAGLNAAVSMFKEFPLGFHGLVAGPDYAYPPRLYFRDGYWTAQILLRFRPDLVMEHLLSLARGVHPDGQCPSGVFAPHLLGGQAGKTVESLDWLPDHYDSPAFFSLLVADYVAATGELSFLDATVRTWNGRDAEGPTATVWSLARKAVDYLSQKDTDGDGLIEKPYAANDWADNVRRNVWVTYDQALYAASLFAIAKLAAARGEASDAERYRGLADRAKRVLNEELWNDELGHYFDYRRPEYAESHFALDSLVALRYGLVDSDKIDRLIAAARNLQTRFNRDQGYGDWGVMCAYPYYGERRDLFGNSAYSLRYHNGADWPYWDGVYAQILQERGDPDWRYALTRWWEYGLSRGWLTPVEYYSPPYEPGGMLQGWSAMPAIVCADAGERKSEAGI